jgi:hypothetical protein
VNLSELPSDPLERLIRYQRARDEERQKVEAALAKEPGERTLQDWTVIQYSPFGTASRCGH